jgi:hypothetical protein
MQSSGSQADSVKETVKLRPCLPSANEEKRRRTPLSQSRWSVERAIAAKLASGDAPTKRARTGMNAAFARPDGAQRTSTRHGFFRACPAARWRSQLMFGSDYPFREGSEAAEGLAAYDFSDADRASINRQTALRLMPRLAG